ncbi:hypothetical protein [Sphingomonas hankookensis]
MPHHDHGVVMELCRWMSHVAGVQEQALLQKPVGGSLFFICHLKA